MLEAFSVGVRIRLIDQVTAGLFMLSGGFRRAHTDALHLQRRLDAIKLSAAAGGFMISVGVGGLALLKPALEEAKRLQQAQAQFAAFGMGDAANQDAARFARAMNVMGSSYVENMRHMVEAQGVFRESGELTLRKQLEGAKLAAPLLAKIDFANSVLNPHLAASSHASALAMLRFIEMRGGLNSAPEFNRIADLGFKAIQSSGGNVNWEQYRQFMARAGTSAMGLSNEALFAKFEPLIGELKGQTAGEALMTAYNRLQGAIRVPNQVAHLLVDNGVWRKNAVIWNSMGGIKRFADSKSPLVDSATFARDPVAFYQKTMLPIYAKMGLDREGRARENAIVFGRTGGKLFNLIDRQMPVLERSVHSFNKAMGIDQAAGVASKTAIGQEIIMRKQLNNLEASAGSAILPLLVSGLKILNPLLWAVSDWANKHPGQLKAVILGFTGLSAAMIVLGGVAVMGSALQSIILFSKVAREIRGAAIAAEALSIAASGPKGVVAALWGARGALIALGLAAAAWWIATHPTHGTYQKGHEHDPRYWKPNWIKGTWWEKSLPDLVFGSKKSANTPGPWGGRAAPPPSSTADGQSVFTPSDIAKAIRDALHGVGVTMDGKKVGQLVTEHQDSRATGPSTGATGFDPRMSPIRPNMLLSAG